MTLGFYIIMAAQFFSALADNALLIVAIAILRGLQAPDGYEPLLKLVFTLSYVALAAFVGAFADSMPKRHVMLISNFIKIAGCLLMLCHVHPLAAYALVGLGAAAYSPAKYGILTEYLPRKFLIASNSWLEGLTVAAIILGAALGGFLIQPKIAHILLSFDFPWIDTGIDTIPAMNLSIIAGIYLIAAIFNMYIPYTHVDHKILKKNPLYLLHDFQHSLHLLWRDKRGQISLAVTSLFWGAGATLQFIVLKWAETTLKLDLSHASILQGGVAAGIAIGAAMAARLVSLRKSLSVLPIGILMGLIIPLMVFIHDQWIATVLMILVGGLAGFFVVPMNALLQYRGHILMGAGHSIAVQNFNENLCILVMTGVYAILVTLNVSIDSIIILFGLFVASAMFLVKKRHEFNQGRRS